jgi:succinate dehydrogenase / fumarate reductase flavoprotein subunit
LEFAELMVLDALRREESCGGHFREGHQTPTGEAQRDDEHSCPKEVPFVSIVNMNREYLRALRRS